MVDNVKSPVLESCVQETYDYVYGDLIRNLSVESVVSGRSVIDPQCQAIVVKMRENDDYKKNLAKLITSHVISHNMSYYKPNLERNKAIGHFMARIHEFLDSYQMVLLAKHFDAQAEVKTQEQPEKQSR